MKTEETIYENDATRFESQSVESNPSQSSEPAKGRKSAFWKSAGAGLGAGVVLGTSSAFATASSAIENGEAVQPETDQNDVVEAQEVTADNQIEMASVSDDMSFSEAFASARGQVGPGGAFEWRGNIYGTYTAEEWDNMSEAERAEYNSHFSWDSNDAQPETEPAVEQDGADDGVEVVASTPDNPVADPDYNAEVQVLGVEYDPQTGATFAGVLYDGQDVLLVDVDNDNVVDLIASDLNGDGNITNDEIADVSNQNINMNDLDNSSMYAMVDGPDYSNDADIDYGSLS